MASIYIQKEKVTHVKPNLYAFYFEALKGIAQEFGYNLVVHGSMKRDLDLIAIPWIKEPKDDFAMIKAFDLYLNGRCLNNKEDYMFSVYNKHRKNYVVNINRGKDGSDDKMYYLDISVTLKNGETI